MRKLQIILLLCVVITATVSLRAQDYLITFAVLDGNGTPDSVLVENQNQSTELILNGNDVLHLVENVTNITSVDLYHQPLTVFPNPIENKGTLAFYNHKNEEVHIGIFNSIGQLIAKSSQFLATGHYSCEIEGLNSGTYLINVSTSSYRRSAVIISNLKSHSTPSIEQIVKSNSSNGITEQKALKASNSIIEMQYNDGENLKFTAFLNSFTSIEELVPASNQTISFNFSPPLANFIADQTNITVGGTINFTDQSTDNPTSWSWDFGDGNSSSETNPSHTYVNAGTYTVALIVTNDYGSDTETKTDYITIGTPPTAGFIADQTNITESGTINFTDQSTNNPTSWSWDFGDGNTSSETNPSHTYVDAGTYTVSLTVTNDYGSDTETKTDYITVGTPPTAGFIADQTNITVGGAINFTDQSANNPTSWSWDFGDGNTSSVENPSHTYDNAGTYTVSLTVTNDYGSDTETKIDYITVGTPPTANFVADQTNITEGESISFTDQSTNSPTLWNWDFGDNNTSSETNPSHTYVNAGTYTVSLTVTNAYGSDTETKTDYIIVIPADGPGDPVSDIDGNTYQTVWIGGQNWMAENLKTTTYNDGTSIDLVTDNATWGSNNTTGAYCWYYNDESTYGNTHGAMYNWHAVNTNNLCPDGWHVPTDDEWKIVELYLGIDPSEIDNTGYRGTNEGSKLAGQAALWYDGELENDSEFGISGMNLIPGGYRNGGSGEFLNITNMGLYWSSSENNNSEGWCRFFSYSSTRISRYATYEGLGLSVRCLKD